MKGLGEGVRDLRPSDVEECVTIVRLNWGEIVASRFVDEVAHAFLPDMKWPPIYFVYVNDEDEVLGFAGMMESWIMHGVWDFIWINVHPDHHHKGIGKLLTENRILEVLSKGGAVINLITRQYDFFKSLGFQVTHLYDGDWIAMTRQFRELSL